MTTVIEPRNGEQPVATVEKAPAKKPRKPRAAPAKTPNIRDDGSLEIERLDVVDMPDSTKYEEYWCGSMPDSLIQNIDVAGVAFPRFVGVTSFDETGKPDRPTLNGQVLQLREEDVGRCLKAMSRCVLRKQGERRGTILSVDGQGFRPDPNRDRPLGEVLYMVKTATLGFAARDTYPKPLIIS